MLEISEMALLNSDDFVRLDLKFLVRKSEILTLFVRISDIPIIVLSECEK